MLPWQKNKIKLPHHFTYQIISENDFYALKLKSQTVWSDQLLIKTIAEATLSTLKFLIIFKKKNLIASMPLFVKKKLMWEYVYSPLQYYYYPIDKYYDPKSKFHENTVIDLEIYKTIAHAINQHFILSEIKLHHNIYDIRSFQWNKFLCKPLYTLMIKTGNKEKINDYSYDKKKNINDASQLNLEISQDNHISEMIQTISNRFEKKRILNQNNIEYYKELLYKLKDYDKLKHYCVFLDHELISFRTIIIDQQNSIAYDFLASGSIKANSSGINSYLLHYIQSDLFSKGVSTYDLCGANIPEVAQFKNDFAAQLQLYFFIKKKL